MYTFSASNADYSGWVRLISLFSTFVTNLTLKGVYLTREKLEEFKKRISDHFYKEAEIGKDLLETNELTAEEFEELTTFIKHHPWADGVREIKKMAKRCRRTKH